MRVEDPGKFIVLLAAIIGGILLALAGELRGTNDGALAAGVGLAASALGYLSGNGRLARRGKTPQPTLGPNPPAAGPGGVDRREA